MRNFFGILFIAFISSCTHEKNYHLSETALCNLVSFSKDIKPLINTRCAISGCHLPGFPQGDYTQFDSIKVKVNNGSFRLRVIDTKSMPPLDTLDENDLK